MLCITEGCQIEALYGVPYKKKPFCFVHKEEHMVKTKSLCIYPDCGGSCSYGYRTTNIKEYCSIHKIPGMLNLSTKLCEHPDGCGIEASFGYDKKMLCAKHKEDEMILVGAKYCEHSGCGILAGYGIKGTKKAQFCTTHKEDHMVDVKSKLCLHETCEYRPVFGVKGTSTVLYCDEHKEDGMVNVSSKKCAFTGCGRQPHYNYKDQYALFCKIHAADDMIDVSVRDMCTHEGCGERPFYNTKDAEKAAFCREHKIGDMKNFFVKECQHDGCLYQPHYGLEQHRPIFCVTHKSNDMFDVTTPKCSCGEKVEATWGYPTKKPIRCFEHKEAGMIKDPRRKCKEAKCSELAIYGELYHTHCEKHKMDGQVNIVEQKCAECGLIICCAENGLCYYCDPSLFKKIKLAKQNEVRDYLLANGIKIHSIDRPVDGHVCGHERPDFWIDCDTHILVIEVDEHQHSGRACHCEQTRMVDISQFNGMATFFLRYNPDHYKVTNGLREDNKMKRLRTLLEWTNHLIKNEPKEFLSVMYLYFDEYVYGQEKIEVMLKYEHSKIE